MLAINDLSAKLQSQRKEILAVVARVVDSGFVILGPEVREFENAFARYIGAGRCVGVANGTDAIELGLKALGVEANDRVATVANAGMYATTAIRAIGARPVFVDVDINSQQVTLDSVSQAISAGVRAVIVTHLYGRAVADTEAIANLCASKRVALLEDCAQAHGAEIADRKVGTFGGAAAFSFYPTKNLGAIGDGGAVVTNDEDVYNRLVQLRQYGWTHKYQATLSGGRNSRLDELQAGILRLFLANLDIQNERRRDIGARYAAGLRHPKVTLCARNGASDVVHLYVIRCANRDGLKSWLRENGIGADIHYPIPDHLQSLMTMESAGIALPNTERLALEILTLPCYPELAIADVDKVIRTVNNWPQ
jgi:dTDP-4-amino-4,6-dideoxygalactose transaminase